MKLVPITKLSIGIVKYLGNLVKKIGTFFLGVIALIGLFIFDLIMITIAAFCLKDIRNNKFLTLLMLAMLINNFRSNELSVQINSKDIPDLFACSLVMGIIILTFSAALGIIDVGYLLCIGLGLSTATVVVGAVIEEGAVFILKELNKIPDDLVICEAEGIPTAEVFSFDILSSSPTPETQYTNNIPKKNARVSFFSSITPVDETPNNVDNTELQSLQVFTSGKL